MEKAPPELGQSKVAMADAKRDESRQREKEGKKSDLDLDGKRQNETRGENMSRQFATPTLFVFAVVCCCHSYSAAVPGVGRHYCTICHPMV